MAISDRITSIEEHIKESYQELEGIGIDTTGVNKNLENIPKLIDGYWETLPKVTGEGTSITLDNTKEGKMKIDLKGNTSQEGTPTPEAPQDIHVVSGDNEIQVCGKNLFDKTTITENQRLDPKGGNNYDENCDLSDYIKIQPNTTYTRNITASVYECICFYTINKTFISRDTTHATTTSPNNAYYVRISCYKTNLDTLQFEKGSSASTYEPYQSASYPINLGEIELCKIGNYQDSIVKDNGKWFLHKEIGKVVFDGSESWSTNTSYTYNVFYRTLNNYARISNAQTTYCEYYKGIENVTGIADFGNNYNNSIGVRTANDNIKDIYISNNSITSASDFKTWLSTHNTVVYYVLANPTYTEITDSTLISQLNALASARSYDTQTNINQENNDLPFILDVTALKQLTQ